MANTDTSNTQTSGGGSTSNTRTSNTSTSNTDTSSSDGGSTSDNNGGGTDTTDSGGGAPGAGGGSSSTSISAGISVNAEMSRKYGFDASSATRVTARIVALPPPPILLRRLGASQVVINEAKGRTPPPDGGAAAPPSSPEDELTDNERPWADFGEKWLEAAEPVLAQVDQLREVFAAKGDDRSTQIAGMLSTLKELLQRFPDSADKVKEMREFLNTDQVVQAAEENTEGVTVQIKSVLLPVLDEAPQ